MLLKVVISILLIIGIINPKVIWMVKGGGKFKDNGPSNLYLVMNRVFSVILLLVTWLFLPN
ncbi:hypothetical protein ACPWSR_07925 [Alloiococcus sp. CFN-8]|uniref:hypothetical protein n=1 Tax=Alloiococcus sp. CFN-8 TaxID=3416081 RepID=UPI003CF0B882